MSQSGPYKKIEFIKVEIRNGNTDSDLTKCLIEHGHKPGELKELSGLSQQLAQLLDEAAMPEQTEQPSESIPTQNETAPTFCVGGPNKRYIPYWDQTSRSVPNPSPAFPVRKPLNKGDGRRIGTGDLMNSQ